MFARVPAEQNVSPQEGFSEKRRKKKKSKDVSRQEGQPFDSQSPGALTSNDPAAVAKYIEDWDAYLRREYGDFYTQYKADQDQSYNS